MRPAVKTASTTGQPPDRGPAAAPASNASVTAVLSKPGTPLPAAALQPFRPVGQDLVGNGAVAAARRAEPAPAPAPGAPTRPGPHADPKFAKLKKDVQRKKHTVASAHPPPKAEAGSAQDAARPPKDDEEAQGKTANAERMNDAEPKEFDREAFIKAVEKAIADKAPKNLDEADKFAGSGKADEVKAEVQGRVGEGKTASSEQIATTTAAPPDTSAAVTKKVVPLTGDRPPGTPAPPDPADAVPDKLPPSATDLSAGPARVDRQMADANVTESQLKKSNEPTFTGALDDKKAAEHHSDVAPGTMRKSEAQQLQASTAQAKRLGTTAMSAIGAHRVRTGQQVGGGKAAAKSRDEEKRAEVTAILQGVFDKMKTEVEDILSGLDKKVDDQFGREEKLARDAFTSEHQKKMEEYKDQRYSGPIGKLRWVKDLFAGLPAEADKIFDTARDHYLQRMRQVISDVATTIAGELKRAKQRIAQGRTELQAAVKKLPAGLRTIGNQAAAEFSGKFDELTQSVDDKGTELVDTLATKYTDALKSVDTEIAEEKEKNKGLVDKAIDAVKGVIQTIIELKNLLLSVLAKAAQAVLLILGDPIGFLGNLVSAVGNGLRQFIRNIGTHLQQGIMAWLLGKAGEAGLQLPGKFDTRGILTMLASLLGLTPQAIWARVSRRLPPRAVAAAETAVPLVAEVRKRGIAGMWDDLKTRIGDLRKNLLDKVIEYVTPTIVIAGITWVLSLLNPASAFVRAVKLIIDIVKFVITQARQIIDFVNAVLDAVIAIARGGAGGVPGLVERALAKSIPVLLGFLASLLGLGGIADKVKKIVQAMAKPVGEAVDWVVGKIAGLVKAAWSKLKPRHRKPDHTAPGKRRPDGKHELDYDKILDAALRDAHALARMPVEEIKPRLPAIRHRHGLTSLTVVVERTQGTDHVIHFVATINPAKESRPENSPLSRRKARADYGILIKSQKRFQEFAEQHDLIIEVRPTNPHSIRHLEAGALFKPVDIKAKTINKADTYLGVEPEKLGLVGFFLKHPPEPKKQGLTKQERAAGKKRYRMRTEERQTYLEKMKKLSRKHRGPGHFEVIRYVVHGYTETNQQKPIAGDHDLYDLRRADGSEMSREDYDLFIRAMQQRKFGVMHGAVVRWDPEDPVDREMKEKLVAQHRRGGEEGLVRFAPGQPMRFVYAETEQWTRPHIWVPPAGEADTR